MTEFGSCNDCSSNSNLGYNNSRKFVRAEKYLSKRNMNSFKMLTLVFLVITTCVSISEAQEFKIDVNNIVNTMDIVKPGRTEPVALHWGIADTSAVVGKMFNYVIPSDAFKGNIVSYKIMEVGKDTLPTWLHFDEKNHQLKGIPSPSDIGQHYLEVVVKGFKNSIAKDVFSVSVTGESPVLTYSGATPSEDGKPNMVRCKRELPETAVNVVIDADLQTLPALQRLDMVNSISTFLNLANDMMKLLPKGDKPMIDSSTLVAGAGNIKEPKFSGVQVSWLVGCGQVEKDHMPVLHHVEKTALNGSLAKVVGFPISGWQVTNTLFQEAPHRRRRAIRATATPIVTRGPPTRVSEVITVSKKIEPSQSEPLSRTVPVMVSSLDIMPTKSVVVPPATPEPTEGMTPKTTPQGTPKPTTEKTEILPTKTHVMTDAPPTDGKPEPTPPTGKDDATDVIQRCDYGQGPIRTGKMKPLMFTAGESKQYGVPEDLFSDCKDGTTSKLRLDLFIEETNVLPANSWIGIQYKNSRWVIVGSPLPSDVGEMRFRITAQNSENMPPAYDDFNIVVLPSDVRALDNPSHEMGLVLDEDFDQFTVFQRKELVKKIRKIYRDDDDENISILRFERGSVKFGWTNNSLPTDSCAIEDIKQIVGTLVNEDGSLTVRAQQLLKDYTINKATAQPKGACMNNPDFPYRGVDAPSESTQTPKPPKPTPEPTTDTPKKAEQETKDDMLITTVVPAVVIIVILIIALMIACCLYRKRRKGKMSLEDKNTFVNNKGAPIIFPDEYDEKPNDVNKPLIMADEKPPMPPPEYTRGSSESSRSSDHKNDEYEMEETDINSPIIQPPPPINSSGGNKQPRPHMQTTYNNKPYVPP